MLSVHHYWIKVVNQRSSSVSDDRVQLTIQCLQYGEWLPALVDVRCSRAQSLPLSSLRLALHSVTSWCLRELALAGKLATLSRRRDDNPATAKASLIYTEGCTKGLYALIIPAASLHAANFRRPLVHRLRRNSSLQCSAFHRSL